MTLLIKVLDKKDAAMTSEFLDPREYIIEAINHLDHILPGQRPLHEFVQPTHVAHKFVAGAQIQMIRVT